MIDRFRVGVITSSHGIKGEAKVYPTSDDQNLIGLDVIDEEGILLGKVTDIVPTGANHVMEVDMGEKKVLFPYISQCILDVDLEEGKIKVHVLDGLLDL